jgi:Mg-chelatase subunit ChlD
MSTEEQSELLATDVAMALESSLSDKPRHVVIAVDVSGSMSGIRLEKAKEGVIKLVESLGDDESFTLVSFDSSVKELWPRTLKKNVSMAGMRELVGALTVGGMTAFYDAIQLCMRRLKSEQDERRQLVLLTDGQDTASESSHEVAQAAVFAPEFPDFVFIVMGINLDHSAHVKVADLCKATHCKMVAITTQSGRGLAVDTAFDIALTRIANGDTAAYIPDEGPVLRGDRHSPACSRCASEDESWDDDDRVFTARFRRFRLDSMDSIISADFSTRPPLSPPPTYQP